MKIQLPSPIVTDVLIELWNYFFLNKKIPCSAHLLLYKILKEVEDTLNSVKLIKNNCIINPSHYNIERIEITREKLINDELQISIVRSECCNFNFSQSLMLRLNKVLCECNTQWCDMHTLVNSRHVVNL